MRHPHGLRAAAGNQGIVLPAIGAAYEGGFFAGAISHTADGVATHALMLIDGKWVMTWAVTPATPEQIAERTSAKESEVRQQRNQLLSACDWTQLPDAPVDSAVWAAYRQELRDVTAQAGFPWEVVWPEEPSNN
jgi:hypothetical protein